MNAMTEYYHAKEREESTVERINDSYLEALNSLEKLESENARLQELLKMALTSHNKMCASRGTCAGCLFFKAKPFAPVCPIISVTRDARELGIEVDKCMGQQ